MAITLVALLSGCGGSSAQRVAVDAQDQPLTDSRGQGFSAGGERGLELRQWLIASDHETIGHAMRTLGSYEGIDDATLDRLRRNGLRISRVPLHALGDLRTQLGGTAVHQVGWHGQIVDWIELMARPLPQQRAIALDGRTTLFPPGKLRFMGRAWVVQMEDATRLSLQIVPQHYRPGPMSYYRLLGQDTGEAMTLHSMSLDLLLDEGFAYVMTCESPLVEWRVREDGETSQQVHESASAAGPDVEGPTTVGQYMLMSEQAMLRSEARGFLIFVPRIESSPEPTMVGVAKGGAR